MSMRPKRLLITIGGYMGPSYSVELSGEGLRYEVYDQGYANPRAEVITPSDEAWTAFRAALDSIRVWRWHKDYPNPGVVDGTQWSVEIVYDDVQLTSGGDNRYPTASGAPSQGFEDTPTFRRLIKAVRTLIGGREFE